MAGIEATLLREPTALDDDDSDKRLDDPDETKLSDMVREVQFVKATGSGAKPFSKKTANTGPKGVLADYAEAREQARLEQISKQEQFWNELHKNHLSPQEKQLLKQLEQQNEDPQSDKELTEEDLDLDEYTPTLIKKFKDQLISSPPRQVFGFLKQITQKEYVEEIDQERSEVPIVIHIFHPDIKECQEMNRMLSILAQRHSYCKFLKLYWSDATETFQKNPYLTLPTLLVYQNTQLIGNFVRIVDSLQKFDLPTLESFLIGQNVLYSVAPLVQNNPEIDLIKP